MSDMQKRVAEIEEVLREAYQRELADRDARIARLEALLRDAQKEIDRLREAGR